MTTDKVKLINFYTSSCFEGCDIYDENGKVYIISDRRKSHTLLDISTLVIQICGRIRDSKYKTTIGHIFTETRYNNFTSLEEFIKASEVQSKESKEWIDEVNATKTRETTISLIEKKNKEGLNEKYIYNNNGFLELDENLMNLDIVNYKITNNLYHYNVLKSEYERYNFIVGEKILKSYTDKLKSNKKAKISFKDLFEEYVILKKERGNQFIFGNENDRIALIEQEKPLVKEAFNMLGIEKVRELNYVVGNIKRAIINTQTDISMDTKIVKCLNDSRITEGITGTAESAKKVLQEVYNLLEIKNSYGKIKTAKATDLKKWFKIKRTTPKIKGKTTDCITIIKNKLIYI